MFRDKAIRNTHPTVVTIRGSGSTATDTNGDTVVLDESAISAEVTRLQAEYDSQEYARNRQTEYPQIGDQLDSLFHAGVFPDDMTAILQAVKDKYPKE